MRLLIPTHAVATGGELGSLQLMTASLFIAELEYISCRWNENNLSMPQVVTARLVHLHLFAVPTAIQTELGSGQIASKMKHHINGLALLLLLAIGLFSRPAHATDFSESVLYGFCDQCKSGYEPRSWMYREPPGNLFGTTFGGDGTVYELVYSGTKNKYTHKVLHNFCSKTDCTDGGFPTSGLIADQSGNLYGTASGGGAHDGGVIYTESFDQLSGKWTYKVLYSFCAKANCTDGKTPFAGLTADDSGNLYGTTYNGGANGFGSIYELEFDQTKQKWVEKVLYSFNCSQSGCAAGANPDFGLYLDPFGNFFGVANDGPSGGGVAFEMSFNQAKQKWVYATIYNFCSEQNCPDGSDPSGRLVADSSGNLYGVTSSGGTHGEGTVYMLSGSGNQWGHSVLYNFCISETCPDGETPTGVLYLDASNNIYGTVPSGAAFNSGAVYQLSYDANKKQWAEGLLYSFCAKTNCVDGSVPTSGVIVDDSGNFYGTTEAGDGGTNGTVYELSPAK